MVFCWENRAIRKKWFSATRERVCDLQHVDLVASHKTRKYTFSMSFKHTLCQKASYDKASERRKHYFLTVSFSPDDATCTCDSGNAKILNGFG